MATSKGGREREEVAPPDGEHQRRQLALRQVIDHALLDRNGRRMGRVDDLRLRLDTDGATRRLVLDAIVTGPLPRRASWPVRVLARIGYGMVGVRRPAPAVVPWSAVSAINALVHLDIDREESGFRLVDKAALRLIAHLPGSARQQE